MELFESAAAVFEDLQLPVIFHLDTIRRSATLRPHWHDNPEMLFFIDGEADVSSDSLHESLRPGDIAIINCSHLHTIRAITPEVRYYCLIVSRELCSQLDVPVGETQFCLRISDERAQKHMRQIIGELNKKASLYRPAVKAQLWELLILFCREYTDSRHETAAESKKKSTVKKALYYMQEHLSEPLTVDEISNRAGFSKYYFCRVFREMTGSTVVNHLNLIRCRNAQRLMLSRQYNVCESAQQSGFSNLSYFTKCYRRHIGELPSKTLSLANGS